MYKICRITDLNNIDKTEKDAVARLDRVIDEHHSNMAVGVNGMLFCVYPGVDKSILTTKISRLYRQKNMLIIETKNSKYWLRQLEDKEDK